jgi:hypothetical protein
MLTIKLGDTVRLVLEGHSALNGAPIPAGSSIALTSNDPAVATSDGFVSPTPEPTQKLEAAVAVLATGSSDFHVVVTDPAGVTYEATDTLVVEPAAEPGLVRVSLTLLKLEPVPV